MEGLQFPDGDIHLGSMPVWIRNLCLAPAFFYSVYQICPQNQSKASQNVTQG